MPQLESFHDERFPINIARGSSGGPVRKTEIVSLVSGHEKRNSKWAHSRRNYNAGYGVKTSDDLHIVVAFFEARRGQLFGFRFRDPVDHKSCLPSQIVQANDQKLGTGDGINPQFQLQKSYGTEINQYYRVINKPVAGSLLVAVDGTAKLIDTEYTLDASTGLISFLSAHIPGSGEVVTAGFEFDVPVRFDTDEISINLNSFHAGEIPSIPMIEIKQ